jgi:hypothetical protein
MQQTFEPLHHHMYGFTPYSGEQGLIVQWLCHRESLEVQVAIL